MRVDTPLICKDALHSVSKPYILHKYEIYLKNKRESYHLIFSPLYSESNWVQLLTPRAIVDVDFMNTFGGCRFEL